MDDFEPAQHVFRGGEQLDQLDLTTLFADVFDLLLYKKVQLQQTKRLVDNTYTSNEEFWGKALKKQHFQSMRIQLQGFHLIEWLPLAPGRFFTSDAQYLRKQALSEFDVHLREYKPSGKESMVRGGIGSVRLMARRTSFTNLYFLGASSTGISHQGIPVVLNESEYHRVMQVIQKHGGCLVNLEGALHFLPSPVISPPTGQLPEPLLRRQFYDMGMPKHYLMVDSVEIIRPSLSSELVTTVAITFPRFISYTTFDKAWSFCSFHPGSADKSLEAAVNWLKSYASRHSLIDRPPILFDFDEHYQHFDNPVEFPLSQMFDGDIDLGRLGEYQTYCNFHFKSRETGEFISGIPRQAPDLEGKLSYKPINLFFSYAHEDENLLNELKKQLKPLQRQNYINMWHDRDITAGSEWQAIVDEFLSEAHIILLLVSPDFMNSNYCYGIELKRAIERYERGEAQVIPIILRPTYWEASPFGQLQALPTNAKPITDSSWHNLDSALFSVAEGIRRVVEQLLVKSSASDNFMRVPSRTGPTPTSTLKPEELVLMGVISHSHQRVESISINSDGRLLASGSCDGTVKLWNPHTGQLLYTFSGYSGAANCIALSPNGQILATVIDDYTIKLWNSHTGQLLRTFVGHSSDIRSIAISSDGYVLASTSNDGVAKLWSLDTGKELLSIDASSKSRIAVGPYEGVFATVTDDHAIRLWDSHTGQLLHILPGYSDWHFHLIFAMSPTGQILASAKDDYTIKFWDPRIGQLLCTAQERLTHIDCLAFSSDEQILVSGGYGRIDLWDTHTGQHLRTLESKLRHINSIATSPQGQLYVGGGYYDRGVVEIWSKR